MIIGVVVMDDKGEIGIENLVEKAYVKRIASVKLTLCKKIIWLPCRCTNFYQKEWHAKKKDMKGAKK